MTTPATSLLSTNDVTEIGDRYLDRMMRPVAFIGKMGSGKTTAAALLADFAHAYQPFHFAGRLKGVAMDIWGPEVLHDRGKMQDLGLAVRKIDENAWVNAMLRFMDDAPRDVVPVVDDCRFPNEYWALKERGFAFVRVTAPETVRLTRLMEINKIEDQAQLYHESETAIDDLHAEFIVDNSGSVEELEDAIGNLIKDLMYS